MKENIEYYYNVPYNYFNTEQNVMFKSTIKGIKKLLIVSLRVALLSLASQIVIMKNTFMLLPGFVYYFDRLNYRV